MSILQKPHKLRHRALILLGVLGILGASYGQTDGGKLVQSARLKLLRMDLALSAIEVGGQQQQAPIDIAPGLKKLKNARLNPTVKTPTEIEGEWEGNCQNSYTSFNGKTARSFKIRFIFIGNSFYRQVDYYPEADCRYSGGGTLAENRVGAEVTAGWFAHRDGLFDLMEIDLLAARNVGGAHMLNVYQMKGSGSDAILLMGDAKLNNKDRPKKATEEYRKWDISKAK